MSLFDAGWQTWKWDCSKGKYVRAELPSNPRSGRAIAKHKLRATKERRRVRADLRRRREKAAAGQLWREFREEPVGRSRVINVEWPKALMVMGSVQLIAYATTHKGKLQQYEHEFAPGSEPLLCAGKKTGQLFLIGHGFKVNAHGIVDIDRDGRRRRHKPQLKVVARR